MQGDRFTSGDWKLFREKVAGWQESYMDKLNREYVELLTGAGDPSDKFWALDKRIKEDKHSAGVRLEMRKSLLLSNIAALLNEGAITMADLEAFSEELKEAVTYLTGHNAHFPE